MARTFRRIFVRPVEPGAGQQPHLGAIDPGVHAISIELELVSPIIAARGFLHQLTTLGLDPRGELGIPGCSFSGRSGHAAMMPDKAVPSASLGPRWSDHRQFFNSRSRGVTVTYEFRSTQALREEIVINQTAALRRLLADEAFIHLPVAYDALGGRLIESTGFKSAYVGGFVTGGSRCTSEPLLTLDEQVRVAGDVARAVKIPVLADAGAGFGEPLHTMRTVREFITVGVAGIHIEDQLFPKRAHYHKYVAHVVPRKEFVDKIRLACRQRDQSDKDFVIIARSDSCRFEGLDEAIARVNAAADNGADMGMIFPRDPSELQQAPKLARIPLVYVVSRGNRDNRPVASAAQLADMGYKIALDALLYLLVSFHFAKRALAELKSSGDFTGLSAEECVTARHDIETLVGLDEYYAIEEETVEERKWGER